jgi:hypothetical protein
MPAHVDHAGAARPGEHQLRDPTLMGYECDYSFADLFRIVRNRSWTDAERAQFESLDREERNEWVRQLAAESAGQIVTEDRRGSDGLVYTAFWRAEQA